MYILKFRELVRICKICFIVDFLGIFHIGVCVCVAEPRGTDNRTLKFA